MYVSNLTITGSDNGLSPGRWQDIIWTNAGILLIGPFGTNISEIEIEVQTFSFKPMRLKVPSREWLPFCLGLNVLINVQDLAHIRTTTKPKHWSAAKLKIHYDDVIMTTTASQITSLTVVYSTVYSNADQRKYQSSASLAFVWGIHRDRWIPRTKGQLRGKCFHLMTSSIDTSHRSLRWALGHLLWVCWRNLIALYTDHTAMTS